MMPTNIREMEFGDLPHHKTFPFADFNRLGHLHQFTEKALHGRGNILGGSGAPTMPTIYERWICEICLWK